MVYLKRKCKRGGLSNTDTFRSWHNMINRCCNSSSRDYKRYGGKGIKVSEEWRDFLTFYSDMGPRPSKRHQLDRVNGNGNYEKENCRWATVGVNNFNKYYPKKKTTLPRGVTKNTRANTFQARIKINGLEIYIGSFKKIEDAEREYLKVCWEWYGFYPQK